MQLFRHWIIHLLTPKTATTCGMIALCLLFAAGPCMAAGNRILFARLTDDNWDLWSIAVNGADLRQETTTAEIERFPSVSPDGGTLAYIDGQRRLRLMTLATKSRQDLPLPPGIYSQPAWSHDATQLAFVKYQVKPTDQSEIWALHGNSNGHWHGPAPLTAFPPMRLFPSYAPDGNSLLFTEFHRDSLLGVVEEIGILDLTTKKVRMITRDQADSFQGVWSPDGNSIVYVSNKAGNYDLWLFSLKEKQHRQLTRAPAYDGEPAWSSDGRRIVFVSTRTGNREIWLASPDGSPARQLTSLHNMVREPCWINVSE